MVGILLASLQPCNARRSCRLGAGRAVACERAELLKEAQLVEVGRLDMIVEDNHVALRDDVVDVNHEVGERVPGRLYQFSEPASRARDAGNRNVVVDVIAVESP